MTYNITVHFERSSAIWQKGVEFLINWFRLYHNITQKTLILLSGGSAVNIYRGLAEFIDTSDLDFGFLAIGQVDERFRPEGSNQYQISNIKYQKYKSKIKNNINAKIIKETGLWEICNIKKIPYYLISQEGTLDKAADEYNQIIEKLFKEYVYKVAVLGIGEDGHTAGLLSGHEKKWNKNKYIVGYQIPQNRQNNAMALFCLGKRNFPQRISLTPKALEQLDQALVVAVGENKKQSLQKLLNGVKNESLNQFPAIIIRNISKVDLFTDLKIV